MEDSTSNDVIITEVNNENMSEIDKMIEVPADKPLMHLFKRLIGNSKQSTMLTNSHIINILQKELNLEVAFLHDLQVDIYLNLMKKFLKDWPQWDPFDRAIKKLKVEKDYDAIRTLLHDTHLKLKEYLKEILGKATPIMEDMIRETIEKNKNEDMEAGENDVYMETYCTRNQLNELILRRPTAHNSIFYVIGDVAVFKNNLSYKSILNWWDVQIEINLNCFIYKREMQHELKHTLVNKKLNKDSTSDTKLNTNWQCKAKKNVTKEVDTADILQMISKILLHYSKFERHKNLIESVFEQISLDLNGAPDFIKLHSEFRRYLSQYSYVRYLCSENEENLSLEGNLYDLQLKEVILPRFVFQLAKLEFSEPLIFPDNLDWITVKCGLCKEKQESFFGEHLERSMVQHFSKFHSNEPDWKCVACNHKFTMMELTENRWEHTC